MAPKSEKVERSYEPEPCPCSVCRKERERAAARPPKSEGEHPSARWVELERKAA